MPLTLFILQTRLPPPLGSLHAWVTEAIRLLRRLRCIYTWYYWADYKLSWILKSERRRIGCAVAGSFAWPTYYYKDVCFRIIYHHGHSETESKPQPIYSLTNPPFQTFLHTSRLTLSPLEKSISTLPFVIYGQRLQSSASSSVLRLSNVSTLMTLSLLQHGLWRLSRIFCGK